VIVTENGLAKEDDTQRVEYLRAAVDSVASCLADGIDVRGYIAWTAFDNYEWVFGYRPKFGLIAVDRETQERIPKESARWLGHQAQEHASRAGLDTPSDVVQPAGHRQGAAVGSTDAGPSQGGLCPSVGAPFAPPVPARPDLHGLGRHHRDPGTTDAGAMQFVRRRACPS
jgi:hypothetical protein